ncbi:MAG: phosphate acyltransferase PlsX [Thermosulfidibacteraceae bacterium]
MRIALDAMGGDYAPTQIIKGAIRALEKVGHEIILVGDSEVVERELRSLGVDREPRIMVKHAPESIGMDENPITALKSKKRSSIVIGLTLLKDGQADAFVSAGNTGAVMAATKLILGSIPGLKRPAIAVILPCRTGRFVLIDAGANVNSKAEHLVEFAIMGSIYAEVVLGKERPKVGLLNIGEEDVKGNSVTKAANNLLRKLDFINFIGNVEAKELYKGVSDVVVCDGYIGNLVLKVSESAEDYVSYLLEKLYTSDILSKIAFLLVRKKFVKLKKSIDYREYGGAPLIGVNGVCVIAHGSSNDVAISNAILRAVELVEARINHRIKSYFERLTEEHVVRTEERISIIATLKDKLKKLSRFENLEGS